MRIAARLRPPIATPWQHQQVARRTVQLVRMRNNHESRANGANSVLRLLLRLGTDIIADLCLANRTASLPYDFGRKR